LINGTLKTLTANIPHAGYLCYTTYSIFTVTKVKKPTLLFMFNTDNHNYKQHK